MLCIPQFLLRNYTHCTRVYPIQMQIAHFCHSQLRLQKVNLTDTDGSQTSTKKKKGDELKYKEFQLPAIYAFWHAFVNYKIHL